MRYIKIILGLLVWAVLFFYVGSSWLDTKRENACLHEVKNNAPDMKIVKRRCLETAEVYMKNEHYGTAAWFYLLGGALDKNLNEVEEKITDDFYMNIGHTYVLKGEYKKAEKIYRDYPWKGGGYFLYADEGMQGDYEILPRIYKNKKENLAKGLALWNKIYAPLKKVVKAHNAYEMAQDAGDSDKEIEALKAYLDYSVPFKDQPDIKFLEKKKKLAELYYYASNENASIEVYRELADIYENNDTKQYEYVETLLSIARAYEYLDEYNSTIAYYEKVLPLLKDANNTNLETVDSIYDEIAESYHQMGVDNNISAYEDALSFYQKSLLYRKEHRPLNYADLAKSHSNIADIYYYKKDYNASIKSLKKAIELKREELSNSENYYRDDILDGLKALHDDLSTNYYALDENQTARDISKKYIEFLEYEYEKHYKHLATVYADFAPKEVNASRVLWTHIKAIEYMKKYIEREEDDTKVMADYELFNYMGMLKKYIDVVENNGSKKDKNYLEQIESFKVFQEKNFNNEENINEAILSQTYNMVSRAYDEVKDSNRTEVYAYKAVDFIKKAIENKNEYEDYGYKSSSNAELLDEYSSRLWSIHYDAQDDKNSTQISKEIKKMISDYVEFKKKYYDKSSENLVLSYETVARFFYNKAYIEDAIVYYKKAMDRAEKIRESSNRGSYDYLVDRNIHSLLAIYTDKESVSRERALFLINDLIRWQEHNDKNEKVMLAETYMKLGHIYSENNETSMVVQNYKKSISLHYKNIEENNNSVEGLYELGNAYETLSIYYAEHNDEKKALENIEEFMTYIKRVFPNEKSALAEGYKYFSTIYDIIKDEDNILKYQEKALNLIEEDFKTYFYQFREYHTQLLSLYQKHNENDKIYHRIRVLKDMLEKDTRKEYQGLLLSMISEAYVYAGAYEESLHYIEKAKLEESKTFKMDCKKLEDIYTSESLYLKSKELMKVKEVCEAL